MFRECSAGMVICFFFSILLYFSEQDLRLRWQDGKQDDMIDMEANGDIARMSGCHDPGAMGFGWDFGTYVW